MPDLMERQSRRSSYAQENGWSDRQTEIGGSAGNAMIGIRQFSNALFHDRSGYLSGHVARQILAVVVVALDYSDVLVPRKPLDRPDVSSGCIQRLCDRRMTQAVGPDFQACLPT